MKILAFSAAICIAVTGYSFKPQKGGRVVQIDIRNILDARPVTTLTNGKLIPWTKGVDGGGTADGYFTMSAAVFNGDKDPRALPDNPVIAANESHPEIKLYYSNKDSVHKQALGMIGASEAEFAVPKSKYSSVYLALTSAEGAIALHLRLTYTDCTEEKDYVIPDFYWDIPANDPNFCYLIHNRAKWGNKNNMTEKDHHNIDLLKIHPDPAKTLKSIYISKTKPGYLVLWAAAGVEAD